MVADTQQPHQSGARAGGAIHVTFAQRLVSLSTPAGNFDESEGTLIAIQIALNCIDDSDGEIMPSLLKSIVAYNTTIASCSISAALKSGDCERSPRADKETNHHNT